MRAIKRAHELTRELGWLQQADVGSLVSGQLGPLRTSRYWAGAMCDGHKNLTASWDKLIGVPCEVLGAFIAKHGSQVNTPAAWSCLHAGTSHRPQPHLDTPGRAFARGLAEAAELGFSRRGPAHLA